MKENEDKTDNFFQNKPVEVRLCHSHVASALFGLWERVSIFSQESPGGLKLRCSLHTMPPQLLFWQRTLSAIKSILTHSNNMNTRSEACPILHHPHNLQHAQDQSDRTISIPFWGSSSLSLILHLSQHVKDGLFLKAHPKYMRLDVTILASKQNLRCTSSKTDFFLLLTGLDIVSTLFQHQHNSEASILLSSLFQMRRKQFKMPWQPLQKLSPLPSSRVHWGDS